MDEVGVVALDIHRDFSKAVVMSQEGDIIGEERISHIRHVEMDRFFCRFRRGTDVVMEATFNWPWIADKAGSHGLRPHLAHSLRAREMARGMAKSDRKDAIFLGRLWLSADLFPESYLAPPPVRRRRALFRQRLLLVRVRTMLKNNIHGQLLRLGYRLSAEVSDLFGAAGRALLAGIELPGHERWLLERKLSYLDHVGECIEVLEARIYADLYSSEEALLLMSIPGVGKLTAYTFLAEVGDVGRFPNGRALAAYAGLLPLANESAERDRGRRTGRCCNRYLRWAAIEAVTGALRASARMRSLHSRVRARNKRKPGKARVAVAREIVQLAWLLLSRGQRYCENPPGRAGSARSRTDPNRASQRSLSAGPAR